MVFGWIGSDRRRAWLSTLIVFLFSFIFCEITVENFIEFMVCLNKRYIFASQKDAESLGCSQFPGIDSTFDLLHSFDPLFVSQRSEFTFRLNQVSVGRRFLQVSRDELMFISAHRHALDIDNCLTAETVFCLSDHSACR